MLQPKKEALRFNENKIKMHLLENINPFLEDVARVLEYGSIKYDDINWMKGFSYNSILSSLKRHFFAWRKGEQLDAESGLPHLAHVGCNLAFLDMMQRIYPQGDDRFDNNLLILEKKIGLDIDEVICDFVGGYCKRYDMDRTAVQHWNFDRNFKKRYAELCEDKDFWMSLEPINKGFIFEPDCYISNRACPPEWTEEWLDRNNFPAAPVFHTSDKAEIYQQRELDLFIDDNIRNFKSILDVKGRCLLMDALHNQKFKVGDRRIFNLNSIK